MNLIDRTLLALCLDYDHTQSPAWIQRLRAAYLKAYVKRKVIDPLFAADEDGAGLSDSWWPIGADPAAVLRWYDEEMAATPRVAPLDLFRMFLGQASQEEIDRSIMTDTPLPADRLVVEWQGSRIAWWQEGRDQIAAALSQENTHGGWYAVVNGMGTSLMTALTPAVADD